MLQKNIRLNQYTNRYTEDDYIKKCNELSLSYIGNHKEKKKGTIIEFLCPIHIEKGIQESDWSHFKSYSKGCPYCTGRYRTTEEFQKMVLNPHIKILSEYKGSEKPIDCYCDECQTPFTVNRPIDLIKRPGGCPTCAKMIRAEKRMSTKEHFAKKVYAVNQDIEVIGEYKGVHDYIQCRCRICGTEWSSIASNLYTGKAGCPLCNNSVGERELENYLKSKCVNYVRQKTFDGCEDIDKLRFDGYDIDNNIAFEFQGEQHYFPVDFGHDGEEVAYNNYISLLRRDSIKRKYCNDHQIKLIEIPYWERWNVANYLDGLKIYEGEIVA